MSTDLPNPAKPLIPVFATEIGGVPTQAVDARELHGFLDIGRDFSNWIKRRIADYGFVEDQDYLLAKTGEQLPSGTKYRFDYHLSLDMAKELAMVERNEMGRTIRRYFIDCERAALQAASSPSRIENIQDLNAILPPHFQLKNNGEFEIQASSRMLFWTLEKRDKLLHPNIDRELLFLVTLDIHRSVKAELIQDALSRFPDNCSVSDPDLLAFIKNWRPSFAAEVH
jgi:phage anti-repressor protein